jgi:addiction module antitoxin, RelB/DinJ family
MAATNIQVRVDPALKAEAEQLFSDIGLDMPTAIRLFLKQSVINNGIPFALERDPFYSSGNQAHLTRVVKDLREGKNSAAHELIEE